MCVGTVCLRRIVVNPETTVPYPGSLGKRGETLFGSQWPLGVGR